jgi:hypothetical protein
MAMVRETEPTSNLTHLFFSRAGPSAGIDAEVAQFFAAQVHEPVVIDEETNKRLRWMVHKRVLVVMVTTYCKYTPSSQRNIKILPPITQSRRPWIKGMRII